MTNRLAILLLALAAPLAAGAAPGNPVNPAFKLRAGAEGKLCLDCHAAFEETLKKAFVHTPVRARNCAGCHNPHASSHGKFLSDEGGAVCLKCHAKTVPAQAKSTHKPVVAGRCADCHDPHASANKFNLVRAGNDLCAGCHKKVVEQASKAKFKHKPVSNACTTCHDAHGSVKGEALLTGGVPQLCLGCHKPDRPIFQKAHLNYPVAKADCTSCHDPHGSDRRGLLYNVVHPPVVKGMCAQCHQPSGSKDPLALRAQGAQLCRGCHSPKMGEFMARSRVHRPVAEGSCLACHSPHAAKTKGLVRDDMVVTCGKCHADTIRRQDLSPTKHAPVKEGQCTACHDPHSSEFPLGLTKADVVETCGACHDWLKHSSHPMGEKVVDPRNKNLRVQCLSCHRSHGTEYKHLMPYPSTSDLCTKCHEKFKR
jgi:predicted CXXCH cytochrome family protein